MDLAYARLTELAGELPLPGQPVGPAGGATHGGGELAHPVPSEWSPGDSQGYTDTFVYRQDGKPLELLYTPNGGATQHYWYELDGRGNVVALTDSFGNLVDQYSYDLWGVPTFIKENVPQPLLYGTYVYDYEIGWYWLSTRSYDPVLERFISPDPSQPGSRSYVYANDEPLDLIDPTGQFGCNPLDQNCRDSIVKDASQAIYNSAVTASAVYDSLTFGGFSKLAGALGANVPTSSQAYQTGEALSVPINLALTVASGGTDVESDAALAASAERVVAAAVEDTAATTANVTGAGLREGEFGRYGGLDSRVVSGDDLTPHHMPQAGQGFTSKNDGFAVMMRTARHALTRDYKGRGRILLQAEAGLPFRTVLARSLWDYRQIEPQSARAVMRGAIQYYRDNFPELLAKPLEDDLGGS